MYKEFKYETVPLTKIHLDPRNPRLVTQVPLKTHVEIIEYLYEYEDLGGFVKKIATEGRNIGAERPYVVKAGPKYIVVEGNTRVAAYRILAGLDKPAKGHSVPHVSKAVQESLIGIECAIAPNRDALLPIMASAHFGVGDKSKWGYLGSRKSIYDEWKLGKSVPSIARAYKQSVGKIKEYIIEYLLYLEALKLPWTSKEMEVLTSPLLEFNPPVRFLQTQGHKEKVGVIYDRANLEIQFVGAEAKKRFKHVVQKLVVDNAYSATASFDAVFADYAGKKAATAKPKAGSASSGTSSGSSNAKTKPASQKGGKAKSTSLFTYNAKRSDPLLAKLMKESQEINCDRLPASATFLLRNIIETLLKDIIFEAKLNPGGKQMDLEGAINLCLSDQKTLGKDDKAVLKEFKNHHLSYLNLGAHGNVTPNKDRLKSARDAVDQLIKRNI